MDNITEATPIQVDTEIAKLSLQVYLLRNKLERVIDNVLSHAGLRQYVSATWATRRSSYKTTGTFDEAIEILRTYYAAVEVWRESGYATSLMPARLSNYSGEVDIEKSISEKASLEAEIDGLRKQIAELDDEWVRRGRWARMFLVTSSAGHIHRNTYCNARRSTTYGWMPEYSGLNEAELLAQLGDHAEAACTDCYPTAPVNTKKKLTVAKAEKLVAGPVITD